MSQSNPEIIHRDEFAQFMQAYQNMVFSTAVRLLGNAAQAEDIAQEVFLKAYENFAQLRTSATAGGWLKTVTTHLTLNHLSRYRKRWRLFSELRRDDAEDEESAVGIAEPDALPDALLEGIHTAQQQGLIEQALNQLPEHQRVPLVLYHFDDMPYEQIARHLHISLAKVKTDIRRARAALAKRLMQGEFAADHFRSKAS